MASDPLYPEISFPFLGVDLTEESADQRPGTAEVGENCRSLDPRSRRIRGASRSGISKYLPVQVDGTATLIQHLQPIVDPTTAGLHVVYPPIPPRPPTPFNGGGPPTVITERPPDDPPLPPNPPFPDEEIVSTPDGPRTVPEDGTGTDLGPPEDGGEDEPEVSQELFVVVKEGADTSSFDAAHSFPSNVQSGSLLCVFIFSSNFFNDLLTQQQNPAVANFEDSLGLTWTLQDQHNGGPSAFVPAATTFQRAWIYTAKVGATGGACDVSWTFNFGHGDRGSAYRVFLWEVSGLSSSSPVVEAQCINESYSDSVHPFLEMVDGVTPNNDSNILLVAGIITSDADDGTFLQVSPTGMTEVLREFDNPPGVGVNGFYGVLYSKEDMDSGVEIIPKISYDDPDNPTTDYGMCAVICRKN